MFLKSNKKNEHKNAFEIHTSLKVPLNVPIFLSTLHHTKPQKKNYISLFKKINNINEISVKKVKKSKKEIT